MAVALQNLILSVVGYFFLIGKYGVRVGDRIQISGVTGDVIDIGLVRLHIAEVGTGFRQTGRIVAFSNAVVFQPDAGIFKQIPGTNFVWHEVSLTCPPDSNYHKIEEKMLAAVQKIFADYKEKMESQYRSMERAIGVVSVTALHPESRLNITQSGLQVVVRYPVELAQAAEVDDRMTREVLNATGREPKLTVVEPAPESQQAATT
jgi:small-conductance mechanosensitive channel